MPLLAVDSQRVPLRRLMLPLLLSCVIPSAAGGFAASSPSSSPLRRVPLSSLVLRGGPPRRPSVVVSARDRLDSLGEKIVCGAEADASSKRSSPRESTRREALVRSALSLPSLLSLAPAVEAKAIPNGDASSSSASVSVSSPPPTSVPAKRSTCYLVDSTIPPTLVPHRASREAAILKNLGAGLGTPKTPYIEEKLTLNNFMNKVVYGAIDAVRSITGNRQKEARGGPNYASFVFFGMDQGDAKDVGLATDLLTEIVKPRRGGKGATAIGLSFVPLSFQADLDSYLRGGGSGGGGGDWETLRSELIDEGRGVPPTIADDFRPIFRLAKARGLDLLALAPEPSDVRTVRSAGLQSVDVDRRQRYVVDSEGFINLTQDPKFQLYTSRSLLKDFAPTGETDAPGDYFAERILVHETAATAAAKYATKHADGLVAVLALTEDVRFMGGMNGRVPRVCKYLNENSRVDEEAVTTILLNPTAEKTLSKSRFLRLEIGTAPNNWTYQTKIADYLWFSEQPKVNLLPRMMNER